MYDITYDNCHKALCSYFNSDQFIIKDFKIKVADDISKGLLGASTKLICKVEIYDNIKEIMFFVKTLPVNKFHCYCAIETGAFSRETLFYNNIARNLKKYLNDSEVFADCYYTDNEKLILQDLTLNSYKTSNVNKHFDVDHCFCAIKCLAEFNAASFLYEHDLNTTLDKLYPEINVLSWYTDVENHPGHKHMMTTIRTIKTVLDVHFTNHPLAVRDKIIELLKKIPEQLRSSAKHRNCLSHLDLWCNNVMFKYNNDNKVENAVLIDFQLMGYSPPALDLIMLIYLNTTNEIRKLYLKKFINYYYDNFCNVIRNNNKQPELFLTYNDLVTTVCECLTVTVGYKHFVLIPEQIILPIMSNDDLFKHFMFTDRHELILKIINENNEYKENLFTVINELIVFVNDFNCNGHEALKTLLN